MLLRCTHCHEVFEGMIREDQTSVCVRCGKSFNTTISDTVRPVDRSVVAGGSGTAAAAVGAASGTAGAASAAVASASATVTPVVAEATSGPTPSVAGAGPLGAELLLTPGQTFDKFEIESALGKGGMGCVFKAYQPALDRSVALKVLNTYLARDAEFIRRFEVEARALGRLSHPNIIGVYDCDRFQGVPYIVMELVEGQSLRARMRARSLTPEESLRLVFQICEALEFAHSKGVLHRDVKPENILIDAKGMAKVGDFGLARLLRGREGEKERLTQSRVVMGTMDYMAPEQRESARDVDARADVYAIGVVLYELLAGKLPLGRFDLVDEEALGYRGVNDVIVKALAQAPERRYGSAKELGSAIWEVLTASRKPKVDPARVKEITKALHAIGAPNAPGPSASPVPALAPMGVDALVAGTPTDRAEPRPSRLALAALAIGAIGVLVSILLLVSGARSPVTLYFAVVVPILSFFLGQAALYRIQAMPARLSGTSEAKLARLCGLVGGILALLLLILEALSR